jgi:hypothetical protein
MPVSCKFFTPFQKRRGRSLNIMRFCRAVHSQTAVTLGIRADVLSKLPLNPQHEDVDVKMRPVLAFARKLTLSSGEIRGADVDEIFAVGRDDRALHDVVAICSLFNLVNRLVNGIGIEASEAYTKVAAQRLAQSGVYAARRIASGQQIRIWNSVHGLRLLLLWFLNHHQRAQDERDRF